MNPVRLLLPLIKGEEKQIGYDMTRQGGTHMNTRSLQIEER